MVFSAIFTKPNLISLRAIGFLFLLPVIAINTSSWSLALSPNVALPSPAGVSECNKDKNSTIQVHPNRAVAIFVHGLNGSPEEFVRLATDFQRRGYQTFCFSYSGRSNLQRVARRLARSMEAISGVLHQSKIDLIGHSMGGLVARKALVVDGRSAIKINGQVRLVTIATPFSGVDMARACGSLAIRVASLGLQDLACWLISGNKWHQITGASTFIRKPGTLHSSVTAFLLIKTDEVGSCREQRADRSCAKDDFVISLQEQTLPTVPNGLQARELVVRAGHVAVIGNAAHGPDTLLSALERVSFHPKRVRLAEADTTSRINAPDETLL